jgi:hypothetical protein
MYNCESILNATMSDDVTQQHPVTNDNYADDPNYENAKLDCMLKAIMPRNSRDGKRVKV